MAVKWYAITALVLTMGSAPLVLAGAPLTKPRSICSSPRPVEAASGFALFLKPGDRSAWRNAYQGIAFIAIVFLLANKCVRCSYARQS